MENATGQAIANNISSLSVDTSGLMTDATGQDIVTAINTISSAISPSANNVTYDNSNSDLTATNVQSAIDELSDEKQDNTSGGTLTGPDFNNLTENKYYSVNTAGSLNAPITPAYGYLEVIVVVPTIIMQRFTRFTSSGSEMCRTYVRQYINSQWYAWIQIY